jgi:hypothetical protein
MTADAKETRVELALSLSKGRTFLSDACAFGFVSAQ